MNFYDVVSYTGIIVIGIAMFLAFKNAADSAKENSKDLK